MFSLLQTDTIPLIRPDSVQKEQLREAFEKLSNIDLSSLIEKLIAQACFIGFKILLAICIYLIGRWLIKWALHILDRSFARHNIDKSVHSFIHSVAKTIMMIIIILVIVQTIGINATSFIALFASAGLAIGMALSGTLQNFAGGVLVLMLRPYKIGDYITAEGQSGVVQAIGMFSTTILTVDNRVIYIPNNAIYSSIIDNYSQYATRRVDWSITISYGDDIDNARKAILEILVNDSRVLKEPEAVVYVEKLGDTAVSLVVRAYCVNADYWGVYFDFNESVYKVLPTKGIHFPYPQLDIHIKEK